MLGGRRHRELINAGLLDPSTLITTISVNELSPQTLGDEEGEPGSDTDGFTDGEDMCSSLEDGEIREEGDDYNY